MEPLHWYVRRLSVMRPAEVAYRVREAAFLQLLKLERQVRFRAGRCTDWRRFSFCTASQPQLPQLAVSFSPSEEEARQCLGGNWGALGFPWQWSAHGAPWHTAPDTGRRWPLRFFGAIPYRTDNPYGDVRVLWEPARLQGLVDLGLLAQHDPRTADRAAQLFCDVLSSWIRDNPYLAGAHYASAMECALRLIAVCHAVDLLREPLQRRQGIGSDFVWLVESHASLICRRLSRHSSSGNHSIAECAGLIYAGLVLREHPSASEWRDVGTALLQTEASRQVLPDGGGIEQAFWYQLFIIDLLGLVQELLASRYRPVPVAISSAVARGRQFLQAFGAAPQDLPAIGDGDGGYALTRHLRISFPAATAQAAAQEVCFPHSGYTLFQVLRPRSVRVIVDHGPLGMAPAFGHGHADALSVTATVDGTHFLVDTGTHAYNQGREWRRYFRGTRAHNTVMVDGRDQAQQDGAFLWSSPFTARVVDRTGRHLLIRHDGYERIGVVHWRAIVLTQRGELLVWDRLEGQGIHDLELNWHLGVDPVPGGRSGEFRLPHGYGLRISGAPCTLHTGEEDPPSGWGSPAYGIRRPIHTLRAACHMALPHEFVTLLVPNSTTGYEPSLEELRSLQGCLQRSV